MESHILKQRQKNRVKAELEQLELEERQLQIEHRRFQLLTQLSELENDSNKHIEPTVKDEKVEVKEELNECSKTEASPEPVVKGKVKEHPIDLTLDDEEADVIQDVMIEEGDPDKGAMHRASAMTSQEDTDTITIKRTPAKAEEIVARNPDRQFSTGRYAAQSVYELRPRPTPQPDDIKVGTKTLASSGAGCPRSPTPAESPVGIRLSLPATSHSTYITLYFNSYSARKILLGIEPFAESPANGQSGTTSRISASEPRLPLTSRLEFQAVAGVNSRRPASHEPGVPRTVAPSILGKRERLIGIGSNGGGGSDESEFRLSDDDDLATARKKTPKTQAPKHEESQHMTRSQFRDAYADFIGRTLRSTSGMSSNDMLEFKKKYLRDHGGKFRTTDEVHVMLRQMVGALVKESWLKRFAMAKIDRFHEAVQYWWHHTLALSSEVERFRRMRQVVQDISDNTFDISLSR